MKFRAFAASACFVGGTLVYAQDSAASEPNVVISMRTSKISETDVRKSIEIFWHNCHPLNSYTKDIKEIKVDAMDEWSDFRLDRGWNVNIYVSVQVPENPIEVPNYDPRVHIISGHTLMYNIGGGSKPGFTSGKRAAQLLCGLPISQNGSETFKSVPELSFLSY